MKMNRPSKRMILIALASVAVVVIAGLYTSASMHAWKSYETRLAKEEASYIQLRDTALSADSAEKRLTAIRQLDDKLAARGDLCKIGALYSWQAAVVPVLKNGVAACKAKVKQLGLVAGPLKALRNYLETSMKVQQIVGALAPGEVLTSANWAEKGLERAQKVASDLKDLSVTGEGTALKDQATKLNEALIIAWKSLIAADEAKDKTAFLTASATVVQAYADYMSLADTADVQIKSNVDAVMKVANTL